MDELLTQFVQMDRVGFSKEELEEYQKNKPEKNKLINRIWKKAREAAKKETCILCGKSCSSFCNSHSIPRFALKRISTYGKVCATLQNEIPILGDSTGVGSAGTFRLICNECDNTVFQEYENPEAYCEEPSSKMLAQIALKNYLHILSKRFVEKELYKQLSVDFPNHSNETIERLHLTELDLSEYLLEFEYPKKAINSPRDKYYLCYYRLLDYVVPYAAQAEIAMFYGFDDDLINDLFGDLKDNRTQNIHIAVFPLKSTSVVMLFVKDGEKRYRKFYKKLRKLNPDDQLAAINYIIFSYSENVYLEQKTAQVMKENERFMDVCRLIPEAISDFGFIDPYPAVRKEYSLSNRYEIPNLLSKQYSIDG